MAVNKSNKTKDSSKEASKSMLKFKSRRWTVGFMVSVSILIAGVLVVLLQIWAFQVPAKWDLTSSGINSLSRGTKTVLDSLEDETIRLTSLYFETDLESDAQKKFRKAANDLLRLYQVEKPSNIETAWINPLQEQTRLNEMMTQLRDKPLFKKESLPYREAIERFQSDIHPRFKTQMQGFVGELSVAGQGGMTMTQSQTAPIERALNSWVELADKVSEDLENLKRLALPRYSDATRTIRTFYDQVGQRLGIFVNTYVEQQMQSNLLSEGVKSTLARMRTELKPWIKSLEDEQEALQNLPALELERLERSIRPDGNALIVESGNSARAIPFEEVWPPLREGRYVEGQDIDNRRFAGEGAITPAILQLIQEEKTAVVFVRFAGTGLFGGSGFGPMGPRPGPLTVLKAELEKFNFIVREWDLSQSQDPPEIDAKLKRTIYVVLRPGPSVDERGMPSRQKMDALQRAAILSQLTDDARAIFFTGWDVLASEYEYDAYLRSKWGIDIDADYLAIRTIPIGPGEWTVGRNPLLLADISYNQHDITSGLASLATLFPRVTVIKTEDPLPEGVTTQQLAYSPESEDIWAINDVQAFQERLDKTKNSKGINYVFKTDADLSGPFPLVLIAKKENAKIAVLASDMEVISNPYVSLQTIYNFADGKLSTQRRAPGNFSLFVNLLHYLNDSLQWLHVASSIDSSRIAIEESKLSFWRVILVGVWPALAILGGGVVWFIRRR